jgi:hypothetical protein
MHVQQRITASTTTAAAGMCSKWEGGSVHEGGADQPLTHCAEMATKPAVSVGRQETELTPDCCDQTQNDSLNIWLYFSQDTLVLRVP